LILDDIPTDRKMSKAIRNPSVQIRKSIGLLEVNAGKLPEPSERDPAPDKPTLT
jgi:hypothetical protein